jgi:hypothetical protein
MFEVSVLVVAVPSLSQTPLCMASFSCLQLSPSLRQADVSYWFCLRLTKNQVLAQSCLVLGRLSALPYLVVATAAVDTIGMMAKLFGLIDIGAFIFFEGSTDELIAKTFDSLDKMLGWALQKIECVTSSSHR